MVSKLMLVCLVLYALTFIAWFVITLVRIKKPELEEWSIRSFNAFVLSALILLTVFMYEKIVFIP